MTTSPGRPDPSRRKPPTVLYDVRVTHSAKRDLALLSPRAAAAVVSYCRKVLRQDPDRGGVKLHGAALKGVYRVKRTEFQILYRVDHGACTVDIMHILPS